MSLPQEIKTPISEFLSKNGLIIIIVISCVIIGYASVAFMGRNNPIEVEIEKVIEAETGIKIDLTPEVKKEVARLDGPTAPPPPEPPKGPNGPAQPRYC